MRDRLLRTLAWVWVAFAGIGTIGFMGRGWWVASLACLVSAAAALPPLWKTVATTGVRVPIAARFALGLAAIVVSQIALPTSVSVGPDQTAKTEVNEQTAEVAAVQPSTRSEEEVLAERLAAVEKKLVDGAVLPMTQKGFPKMYALLGKKRFEEANGLTRWAAVAAGKSSQCPQIDNVDVSGKATRARLVWFVDCSNKERFMIAEDQAKGARTEFDPKAKPEERATAASLPIALPRSARWKDFKEADAVSQCDILIMRTAVNRSSVDTAWGWDTFKDDETGHVTIERDFDAQNAFGGTISSRYRCIFDADAKQVIGLSVREVAGWRKLF